MTPNVHTVDPGLKREDFSRRVFRGWIVPGIAIREGVKKSLDIMADKFQGDYGKVANNFVVIVALGVKIMVKYMKNFENEK